MYKILYKDGNAEKGQEYSVDEDDMDGLIRKILRLDEIQG